LRAELADSGRAFGYSNAFCIAEAIEAMATSMIGPQPTNTVMDFSLAGGTSTQSVDSFAQQLLTAIEGYLGNSGNNSQLNISIQSAGQNSAGSSQFVVTVQDPPASTTASGSSSSPAASLFTSSGVTASGAASTTASAAIASTIAPVVTTASTSPASVSPATVSPAAETPAATAETAVSTTGGESLSAAQLAKMTPTEAYWAEQPPAVQALQNMPMDERGAAAQSLAAQGYTIDVPIMVWGWDPLATMLLRQADGYTWVPSAAQADVGAAPGINYSSSANYNSSSPPPGSILVTTAFANGTNGDDPVAKNYETQATS
jgi:hypothetical protein